VKKQRNICNFKRKTTGLRKWSQKFVKVKDKLFPAHALRDYGGAEVEINSSLPSAQAGLECSAASPPGEILRDSLIGSLFGRPDIYFNFINLSFRSRIPNVYRHEGRFGFCDCGQIQNTSVLVTTQNVFLPVKAKMWTGVQRIKE
jgi:hypothetical protein